MDQSWQEMTKKLQFVTRRFIDSIGPILARTEEDASSFFSTRREKRSDNFDQTELTSELLQKQPKPPAQSKQQPNENNPH